MEDYFNNIEYDINLLRTVLETQDKLGKEGINKLILLLEKKESKRYNTENKIKDKQKNLRKYYGKAKSTGKTK